MTNIPLMNDASYGLRRDLTDVSYALVDPRVRLG